MRHGGRRDADPRATVREWLEWHGQTPRLIELLWEPLAVASLNQSIDEAAGEMFGEVLRRTFTSDREAIPRSGWLPRRSTSSTRFRRGLRRATGRRGQDQFAARVRVDPCRGVGSRQVEHVSSARRGLRDRLVLAARDCSRIARPRWQESIEAAESTAASPIVTVNLWFDRPVTSSTFVGLPGRAMQWVFDKRALFGETTSHLSLVSSGAVALVNRSNQEIVDLALDELKAAMPGGPLGDAAPRRRRA